MKFLNTVQSLDAQAKLVIFPHAGGLAHQYSFLIDALPASMVLELPGRGFRVEENVENFSHLVSLAKDEVLKIDQPLILFGHSMGALLAFELYKLWPQNSIRGMVLSGVAAPHLFGQERGALWDLDDDEKLMRNLTTQGGVPSKLIEHETFKSTFLPMIKRDLSYLKGYSGKKEAGVIECPVLTIAAENDPVAPMSKVQAWREYAKNEFEFSVFPGNHFYFEEERKNLIEKLKIFLNTYGENHETTK